METDDTSRERVKALSKVAFDRAVARWQRKAPLDDDVVNETVALRDELRQIASDLRQGNAALHRQLSDTISESLLDFKYALDAPPGTSLRLNQYIESKESKKKPT